MPTLKQNQTIGAYKVVFPIHEGQYAETYRVKDAAGKNYFLKLFNLARLHRSQFDADGKVLEIEISKHLNHPNVIHYHDSDELIFAGQKIAYAVYDFISGETAAAKTTREQRCSVYLAKKIVEGVLEGLKYLHTLPNPIIHNELTIQNIMLDMDNEMAPIVIDFGYARFLDQDCKAFQKEGLNPFYLAPEAMSGVFTAQTDLFQVGIMLYHLLFGLPPYYMDLAPFGDDRDAIEEALLLERRKPLRVLNSSLFELDEQLINIIAKATASDVNDRFQSADEFLKALRGEIKVDVGLKMPKEKEKTGKSANKEHGVRRGNGFADVIGMEELKAKLTRDVIKVLKDPEGAAKFNIHIPNGILFYGPPGCGKTYFARKFAEEAGLNFMEITCSDIASPYIHGGQTKIAGVFDEARKNAPTILFMDEVDALIADRGLHNNVSESGEVNEFLSQLNESGKDGVLVIAATNYPSRIDKAAIRAGRLEHKYYIPMPNAETRKGLLELYLRKTQADFGIDTDKLAKLTENYSSKELQFIVDEAAHVVYGEDKEYITMEILEEVIRQHKPNLTKKDLEKFEQERRIFEGDPNGGRKPIGFC